MSAGTQGRKMVRNSVLRNNLCQSRKPRPQHPSGLDSSAGCSTSMASIFLLPDGPPGATHTAKMLAESPRLKFHPTPTNPARGALTPHPRALLFRRILRRFPAGDSDAARSAFHPPAAFSLPALRLSPQAPSPLCTPHPAHPAFSWRFGLELTRGVGTRSQ